MEQAQVYDPQIPGRLLSPLPYWRQRPWLCICLPDALGAQAYAVLTLGFLETLK